MWVLMVFFTTLGASGLPNGFSTEFNTEQSCLSAYSRYYHEAYKKTKGENSMIHAVCVKK